MVSLHLEDIFQLITHYEQLLRQWKESLAGKISQDRAKALERDRKIRHLEKPLHAFQEAQNKTRFLLQQAPPKILEYAEFFLKCLGFFWNV